MKDDVSIEKKLQYTINILLLDHFLLSLNLLLGLQTTPFNTALSPSPPSLEREPGAYHFHITSPSLLVP